jgi:hypothetical protein
VGDARRAAQLLRVCEARVVTSGAYAARVNGSEHQEERVRGVQRHVCICTATNQRAFRRRTARAAGRQRTRGVVLVCREAKRRAHRRRVRTAPRRIFMQSIYTHNAQSVSPNHPSARPDDSRHPTQPRTQHGHAVCHTQARIDAPTPEKLSQ